MGYIAEFKKQQHYEKAENAMLDVMKASDEWTIVEPLSRPLFGTFNSRTGEKTWDFARSFCEGYSYEHIFKEPFYPLPKPALPADLIP